MRTFEIVARVASECRADGLPVMVEALPCLGLLRIPEPLSPEAMASAARIAFEHGADIVKTYYTGTPEGFHNSDAELSCANAHCGRIKDGHGKSRSGGRSWRNAGWGERRRFGRNIWQSQNVPGAVSALRAIIHSGATVDQALELVGS